MIEPTGAAADAATSIFNLPGYTVISATVLEDGRRQIIVETDQPPGCPSCGVVATRRKERRFQRIRDIPVAGAVEVLWSKYRWHCEEPKCARLSFFESTAQVPRRARSTGRLRDHVVDAVINSGRAVSETAAAFAVSWWLVRAALTEACLLTQPEVDELSPRILGIDEHRFRSVRYFRATDSASWIRHEPWMTTIVDLDTGQVLGVVDGRDHKGVGDWLFARPLQWRLGVQVVAIDPSAAFRKALRMWLPRTAVAVDHFHLVSLGNQAMTEARQNLSQRVKGRRGRGVDKAWAHRMLLLRAGDALSEKAAHRLAEVFAADDPTGKLQAVWKVKEQLRVLLRTNSLADAAAAKEDLKVLVEEAGRPETNKLYRTICRWWNEIEVLIVTGATTGKVEGNNTGIKHIKGKSVNRPLMTGHAVDFQKLRVLSCR
ncbi:transposase [Pseudarthrobacter oxydans]|uniref:ISL3 family transposase n=1 Tax=Pseudarthrobacter oxydans TaxID=1671 RepID=UPI00278711BE|nr:ISL3 family transposase [Pseudarthrobacter oxydans]MDP9982277.1 transposase [Pseudarthrobacter oxydans]